eukprot:g5336.t1
MVDLVAGVKNLLAAEQYDSAELLGSFLVNSSASSDRAAGAQALELYGDALRGKGEQRRAAAAYDTAATKLRAGSSAAHAAQLYGVVFKAAQCYTRTNQLVDALQALESIPERQRTLAMHMAVGRLCQRLPRDSLNTRKAVQAYLAALHLNCFALEALLGLLQLGMSAKDVLRRQAEAAAAAAPQAQAEASSWLKPLLTAHGYMEAHQHEKAVREFEGLSARHPQNAHVRWQLGRAHRARANVDAARVAFSHARRLEPLALEHVDEYAVVLQQRGECMLLNELVHSSLGIDNRRAPPWVAAAVYSAARGDNKDKALGLVDQALLLEPAHAFAHLYKGQLLLSCGRAAEAVPCFRRANELRKEFDSFCGLVTAYRALPSYKDALHCAKQALQLNAKNVRAITLVGTVMASSSKEGGHSKAVQAFRKALQLDPSSIDAIMALVDLHLKKGEHAKCIELLKQRLDHKSNQSEVQAKLAHVYASNQQLNEALTCYHQALSFNKYNEDAQQGLAKLERQIAGEDTEEEDGEDGEEGEGFDDSEYNMGPSD